MRRWAAVAAALVLSAAAWGQELPEMESETDSEQLAELLEYLRQNPIELNRATAEELMLIPWLSPVQALRIEARLKGRPLADPSRLVDEGVMDQGTFQSILPYIFIEGKTAPGTKTSLSSRWQRNWTEESGISGSPWENRQRLDHAGSDVWRALLQTQKDRGEGNWLDYWSGSAGYRARGGRFGLVAGDYQLRSGTGLAFGGTNPRLLYPGSFPKTSNKTSAAVHTSSSEWSALRGLSAWGRMGDFVPLAAFSWRRVDGSTDSAGDLHGICTDGYHRTESELARRHNAEERLGVVSIAWEPSRPVWLGALGYACDYRPGFAESLSINSGASLSGGLAGGPGYVSFELAATEQKAGALSALAGARASGTEASLLVYAYQPGYRPPRFNAYERYGGSDEQGAAVFQRTSLPLRTSLSSVFHWYRPWSAASTVGKGSGGYLLDLRADNGIIKNLNLACRWRLREAERAVSSEPFNRLGRERSYLAKAALDWMAGSGFTLSAGYAVSLFLPASGGREKGDMLTAGAGWAGRQGIQIRARSSFFRTDSYYAAIYQNEPELRSTGSFHPLFGAGRRDALLARYTYAKRLSAELKLAYTYREYQGETVRQAEMGFQMEIR